MASASASEPRRTALDISSASERIGKYEVQAEIGRSTVLRVVRAFDRDTGRAVTLKVLSTGADGSLTERFRRDVAAAANLASRRLAAVYELGEHESMPFAAMQHLGEENLRQAIAGQRPGELYEKMLLMAQVAEGLHDAHRGGLPYVGPRPSGIVLASGGAIIRDFGVVRLGDSEEASLYTAPEEVRANFQPDSACDIFAFGVICYETLTGLCPAPGEHAPPLRELASDCPESLERLVHRAMDRQREIRFQSIEEIQDELEAILRDLRRSRVASLLLETRHNIDGEQLDQAQDTLRRIQELEPGNRAAQRLRGNVRDLVERRALEARVEAMIQQGEELAAAGDLVAAADTLHSALRLNVENTAIRARLAEVSAHVDRLRIDEQLAKVKELLSAESFDDANAILNGLRSQFPGAQEVKDWIARADEMHAVAERRARLKQQLGRAQAMINQQRFHGGIAMLEALAVEHPEETEVTDLLGQAKQALEKAVLLGQAMAQCDQFRQELQFEKAIASLDVALSEYPHEPALLALRRGVEDQWRRDKTDRAVRETLEQAQWLLERNRPDLALQLLREKTADYPDEQDLQARLLDVEQTAPAWEQRRMIADALARADSLEKTEQSPVALTVLEEALQTCAESEELQQRAARLRGQIREQERQKKVQRRVEMIRQCLGDGDTQQAEELLEQAGASLGADPALVTLREELETDKKFQEEWRKAQVLFGRRQFEDAQRVLENLAASNRPEVQVLLKSVRDARAAKEEEQFSKSGRETARKLIEQQQYSQAADMLRNLVSLFPDDPILERDLKVAEAGLARALPPAEAEPPLEEAETAVPMLVETPQFAMPAAPTARFRSRWAALAIAGILVLSGGAVVWKSRQSSAPPADVKVPSQPIPGVTPPAVTPEKTEAPPAVSEPDSPPRERTRGQEKASRSNNAASAAVRPFTPPSSSSQPEANNPLAAPPPNAAAGSREGPALPSSLSPSATAPAPPASGSPRQESARETASQRASGGVVVEPKLISRTEPVRPPLARQRGLYGTVKLEATVDERGRVTNVAVVTGDPVLAIAAKNAVQAWRYQPGTLNGRPIPMSVAIQIVYEGPK